MYNSVRVHAGQFTGPMLQMHYTEPHQFGNLGKTIAEHILCHNEQLVLGLCPWPLVDPWVQMVVPPLPQLLRGPVRHRQENHVLLTVHARVHNRCMNARNAPCSLLARIQA